MGGGRPAGPRFSIATWPDLAGSHSQLPSRRAWPDLAVLIPHPLRAGRARMCFRFPVPGSTAWTEGRRVAGSGRCLGIRFQAPGSAAPHGRSAGCPVLSGPGRLRIADCGMRRGLRAWMAGSGRIPHLDTEHAVDSITRTIRIARGGVVPGSRFGVPGSTARHGRGAGCPVLSGCGRLFRVREAGRGHGRDPLDGKVSEEGRASGGGPRADAVPMSTGMHGGRRAGRPDGPAENSTMNHVPGRRDRRPRVTSGRSPPRNPPPQPRTSPYAHAAPAEVPEADASHRPPPGGGAVLPRRAGPARRCGAARPVGYCEAEARRGLNPAATRTEPLRAGEGMIVRRTPPPARDFNPSRPPPAAALGSTRGLTDSAEDITDSRETDPARR